MALKLANNRLSESQDVTHPNGMIFKGITDPQERKIIQSGGTWRDVEAHRETKIPFSGIFKNSAEAEAEFGKFRALVKQNRELENKQKPSAKPAASGVVHRAAAPTTSFQMPTAEAIAAEVIRQQAAAPKPLTGLALTTAAFQKASAAKAATATPGARNPDLAGLTGRALVEASFKSQSDKSN